MSRLGDTQTFNEDLLSESASEPISGTEKRPEAPKVPGIEVSPTKCESGKTPRFARCASSKQPASVKEEGFTWK